MKHRTMQLQRPFGRTLLLAILMLFLFICVGELVTRTGTFQSYFARPTWGSRHKQFEKQMDRLNYINRRDGTVDCIFLGNSMPMRGFDPVVFANTYLAQTGQDFRCFNFGVQGMPAVGAAAAAKILVKDYQPRVLIYGTSAYDYVVDLEHRESTVLLETPWIRYRLGEFTVMGWLVDISTLLRYRETLSSLLHFDFGNVLRAGSENSETNYYGFDSDSNVTANVATPPDPDSEQANIQFYFGLLSDYEMLPEHLRALEEIAALADDRTAVILLAMPVPETYFSFFDNGVDDYQMYLNQLDEVAKKSNISLWIANSELAIPDSGWLDYSHLNPEGAHRFSQWLGTKFAEAMLDGELSHSPKVGDAGAIKQ